MTLREKNRFWITAEFWAMIERRNISLRQAANMLGVSQAFLYQIKTCRRKPSRKVASRMGYLLFIETRDFARLV